jgi:hypothetical protein
MGKVYYKDFKVSQKGSSQDKNPTNLNDAPYVFSSKSVNLKAEQTVDNKSHMESQSIAINRDHFVFKSLSIDPIIPPKVSGSETPDV